MNISKALDLFKEHVSKHSSNKYQNSLITEGTMLQVKEFTLLTAVKYIARYLSKAGEKQYQTEDLLKAAHFIMFEIQNRLNSTVNPTKGSAADLNICLAPDCTCEDDICERRLNYIATLNREHNPKVIKSCEMQNTLMKCDNCGHVFKLSECMYRESYDLQQLCPSCLDSKIAKL